MLPSHRVFELLIWTYLFKTGDNYLWVITKVSKTGDRVSMEVRIYKEKILWINLR